MNDELSYFGGGDGTDTTTISGLRPGVAYDLYVYSEPIRGRTFTSSQRFSVDGRPPQLVDGRDPVDGAPPPLLEVWQVNKDYVLFRSMLSDATGKIQITNDDTTVRAQIPTISGLQIVARDGVQGLALDPNGAPRQISVGTQDGSFGLQDTGPISPDWTGGFGTFLFRETTPLTGLERITELRSLDLSGNAITSIEAVTGLQIIDDSELGFSVTGTDWQANAATLRNAFEGDYQSLASTSDQAETIWDFGTVPKGQYAIYATWPNAESYTTQANFTVTYSSTAGQQTTSKEVNQQLQPNGRRLDNRPWQLLFPEMDVAGDLVVRLTRQPGAGGILVADAVRLEPLTHTSLREIDLRGNPLDDRTRNVEIPWFAQTTIVHFDIDGNNDGVVDNEQPNVTTLPNGVDGNYVTLESPDGTTIEDVQAGDNPSPEDTPRDAVFPAGFLDFTIVEVQPGAATTVTILLESDQQPASYYKYGPTSDNPEPHWYEYLFDGTTGAEIFEDRIVLHFVDGQRGDGDLQADGRISDPGGPVTFARPAHWDGDNPVGLTGNGTDWRDETNWTVDGNSDAAPHDGVPGDHVVFATAPTVGPIYLGQDRTVASATFEADFTLAGHTLTVTGGDVAVQRDVTATIDANVTGQLNKNGEGILVLNRNVGSTVVAAGRLEANGNLSELTVNRSGTVSAGSAGRSFSINGNADLVGTLAVEVDEATDLMHVVGTSSLFPNSRLEVKAIGRLGEVGHHSRTIITAGSVTGTFSNEPRPGQHLGFGVFVPDNAVAYHDGTVEITLFQAAVGDFDGDGEFGCHDVDAIVAAIMSGSEASEFDLTSDGLVEIQDLEAWLSHAGSANLPSGESYLLGDANLNGRVDAADLNIANLNWRQSATGWCQGDFNADGVVNAKDLNAIALNWRHGSSEDMAVAGHQRPPRAPLAHRINPKNSLALQDDVILAHTDSRYDRMVGSSVDNETTESRGVGHLYEFTPQPWRRGTVSSHARRATKRMISDNARPDCTVEDSAHEPNLPRLLRYQSVHWRAG